MVYPVLVLKSYLSAIMFSWLKPAADILGDRDAACCASAIMEFESTRLLLLAGESEDALEPQVCKMLVMLFRRCFVFRGDIFLILPLK